MEFSALYGLTKFGSVFGSVKREHLSEIGWEKKCRQHWHFMFSIGIEI